MHIEVNGALVMIEEDSFMNVPLRWMFELSGDDFKRMCLLRWRFSFFADKAKREIGPSADCREVFYESQQALCTLLGFSKGSRTKVGMLLSRMEEKGFISVVRDTFVVNGKIKPRHFIIVNDPHLLSKYGLT